MTTQYRETREVVKRKRTTIDVNQAAYTAGHAKSLELTLVISDLNDFE